MTTENLFDIWAKGNPKWEIHFEEIISQFADYSKGTTDTTSARGKVLGAGYEFYIYAFFVGLYANKKRELKGDTKGFGHLIQYWGNIETRKLRKGYPRLREYIFTALIAKTDLDLIALEKGEINERQAVNLLMNSMEQYANYGFHVIEEKIKDNPDYFYRNTGFLDMILGLLVPPSNNSEIEIEEL